MRADYKAWLEAQGYGGGTVTAQLHRAGRVEEHYGNLDKHYRQDQIQSVIDALRYTAEDERRGRSNPSKIPFDGKPRTNLASYRNAVENYRRFSDGLDGHASPVENTVAETVGEAVAEALMQEDVAQRIGLERDMQAALRNAIDQLEVGLKTADDGRERIVESGRIDITARDAAGATVVIELKAGPAGQRAVAQILSYMGDVVLEEPDTEVRGILVASAFDRKAVAAARMAPALSLQTYSVKFMFNDANA